MALCGSPLALVTKGYWLVSQAFEGQSTLGVITVEDALQLMGEAQKCLNPARNIAKHISRLQQSIIHGNDEGLQNADQQSV